MTDTAPTLESYYQGGPDHRGRTLDEVLAWSNESLEHTHDYIQWMFPLPERSSVAPFLPTLTRESIQTFTKTPQMKERLLKSFERMLGFYGFELLDGQSPKVVRGTHFDERACVWLSRGNHNFLRLSRILRSCRLLGQPRHSEALFAMLAIVYEERSSEIGTTTFEYWQRAAGVDRPRP